MVRFILERGFSGILSLLLIVILVSGIIFLSPVDPATLSFGQQLTEEGLETKRKELFIDKSISKQILLYLNDLSPLSIYSKDIDEEREGLILGKVFEGKKSSLYFKKPFLRRSFQTGDSVLAMIKSVLPNTMILAVCSILLASILGILFGIIAGLNKGKKLDEFIVAFSTLGYSVPSYVSAILLSIVFGYYLKEHTHLNMQGSLITLNDLGDEVTMWRNLILPSIALGVRPVAVITQIARASMIDVLDQPYILTARVKGMGLQEIVRKHIFRNMMNPVVTTISGWFAALLAGAFFVESIFNYNGMGLLTVNALINYDIPLLLGCILFIALIFILLNLLIDLIYAWLDPKIIIA